MIPEINNNPLKRTRELEIVPFRNKKVCREHLTPDIYHGNVFPILDIIDLLHFRTTSLTYKKLVEWELVQRINRGEITFRDIGLKTITQVLQFFTCHTENIMLLDLKELVVSDSDLDIIKNNFPKLQSLHLKNTEILDTSIFTQMKCLKTLELIECTCTSFLFDMSFVGKCQLEALILNGIKCNSLNFLQVAPSLIKLDLSNYNFINEVFSYLQYCTSLKDLSLVNTSFYDVSPLRELPLTRLVLNCKRLSGPIVLKEPKSLIELNLSLDEERERMDLEFIENFTNLKKLIVNHVNDLKILANCTSLCELEFSSHRYQDEIDLIPLTDLPLKKLTINALCLNFEVLSTLISLTHLDISKAGIEDMYFGNLDLITELPLETLIIRYSEDWTPIKNLTKLTKLDLRESNFDDFDLLVDLPLEYLDLTASTENLDFSSLGSLKRLKTLHLGYLGGDLEDLSVLQQLVDLEVLSLEDFDQDEIEGWESISHCKKLKELNLAESHIPSLNFIKNLKFLKTLNVNQTVCFQDFKSSLINCDRLSTIIYANTTELIINIKNQIEGIHQKYYQSVYEGCSPHENLFKYYWGTLDKIQLAALNGNEQAQAKLEDFREDVRQFQVSQDPKDPGHLHLLGHCYEYGIGVDENMSLALLNYYLAARTGKPSIWKEEDYTEHFKFLLDKVYRLANEGDSECQSALQFCYEHGMINEMPNAEEILSDSEEMSSEIEEVLSDSDM